MKTRKGLIFSGLFLMIAGWSLVMLMVIDVLSTTYAISLTAYGLFLVGFTIGMTAVHAYAEEHKRLREYAKRREESF